MTQFHGHETYRRQVNILRLDKALSLPPRRSKLASIVACELEAFLVRHPCQYKTDARRITPHT